MVDLAVATQPILAQHHRLIYLSTVYNLVLHLLTKCLGEGPVSVHQHLDTVPLWHGLA